MKIERRRIQLTGGFTYIVSLPKKWAEKIGIRQGDYVLLIPQPDMSLLMVPDKVALMEKANREIVLPPTEDPEECVRNLVAAYIMGYDVIRIKLAKPLGETYTDIVKRVAKYKLIGAEIMGESADEILIRCLIRRADLPLKDAINRMYMLVKSMCVDMDRALEERSLHLLGQICARDDDVDRLYFFVLRQLKEAIKDRKVLHELGLNTAHECLDYQLISRYLERMADHTSRAACVMKKAIHEVSDEILHLLKDMCKICSEILDKTMKSLRKLDTKLANDALSDVRKAVDTEYKAIQALVKYISLSPTAILHVRIALESLRRLCEYSADVAEIVIDLSIDKKTKAFLRAS